MRLIDANKIEFNTVRYPIGAPWPFNKEEQATMGEIEYVSKYQIENQPTVKAIPIEWLKKKAQEFAERYWSKQDDHKKLILPMVDCPIVIEQMIKEWGYESAANRP